MSAAILLQGQNLQTASQWQSSQNQHFKHEEHPTYRAHKIALLLFAACCAGIAAVTLYPYRDEHSPAHYGQEGFGVMALSLLAAVFGTQNRSDQQTVRRLFNDTLVPPIASRLNQRDACSSPPGTVAVGNLLSVATPSQGGYPFFYISRGANGNFLEAWANNTAVFWRLINSSYVPGNIASHNYLVAGAFSPVEVLVASLPSGGYSMFAIYPYYVSGTYPIAIDVFAINSTGSLTGAATMPTIATLQNGVQASIATLGSNVVIAMGNCPSNSTYMVFS